MKRLNASRANVAQTATAKIIHHATGVAGIAVSTRARAGTRADYTVRDGRRRRPIA